MKRALLIELSIALFILIHEVKYGIISIIKHSKTTEDKLLKKQKDEYVKGMLKIHRGNRPA